MKKFTFTVSHRNVIAIIAALVMAVGGVAVYAATPGGEDDPVVTQSYVDEAIAAALANAGTGSSGVSSSGSAGTYSVVHLDQGQKLIGAEGTEVILRSGEATAIDNGANGVSDLTAGTDLKTGTKVELNHMLLIPRNDGRGLLMGTECYLMVRGGYTLK